jgi:hypothetical protein
MGRHDQSAPSLTWTLPDGTRGINRACPHPGFVLSLNPYNINCMRSFV